MAREDVTRAAPPGSRMQPTDALFWYAGEAIPELRPLVGGMLILEHTPDLVLLRTALQRWMARIPRLRQRVVESPLRLGLPEWEDDPHFDLEYHTRQVVLPHPGTDRQLMDFAGAVFADPLDPLRPLWEAYLIEGVGAGRAACFFKVHHSVMDGVGSVAGFEALTQARRDEVIRVPRAAPPRPPRSAARRVTRLATELAQQWASGARTLLEGTVGLVLHPVEAGQTLTRAVRGVRGVVADLTVGSIHDPLAEPGTGVGRRLDGIMLALPRLRRIKDALGITLNDLVLTAVAGAVGRYHDHRHVHVETLYCMVPINLREERERAALGNRVGMCNIRLPVGERQPLMRLERVRAQTCAAKRDRRGAVFPAIMGTVAFLPGIAYRLLAQTVTERINLICTNVPGPGATRYLAGAKIETIYPFAPVAVGAPLSIALMSYADVMGVGIDTDPAAIPDPERLARYLMDGVDELERITLRRSSPKPRRQRPKRVRAAGAR